MFLYFLLFSCNDYIIAGIQKHEQEILVYPQHINFGHLVAGQQSGEDTFSVINTGDADLTIFAPNLVSGNSRFSLETDQLEYIIGAGELLEFSIGYIPETFESNGAYIEIISDDENEPISKVTLEGFGDAPVMTISPSDFDYGNISIGCDNEEHVTIRNDGNIDLTISSISQMVTQPVNILMEMGSMPEPPWILIPGQEIDFLVSYIPTDIGYDESLITITGNDPHTPQIDVTQHGDGDVEQWFTQSYQQEEIPVLDVLWVIDNSGSMNQHQSNLATNIGSFINAFSATGADYNMAVITTDQWTFSTILTPFTPNVEAELASLVVTGVTGSGMEKGIEMSYRSLNSTTAAGPGGNFFRENATLIVIYVSDEQDWSTPDWSNYITFFQSIKAPGKFVPYGVIADAPNGCSYTYNGYQRFLSPGWGYWDLIDHYGGSWYSICATDWGIQLQDLAGEVTGRRIFNLDETDPITTTIEVIVNGQITTEWTYDTTINAITFNESYIPEEGQTIEINYAVWGCGNS